MRETGVWSLIIMGCILVEVFMPMVPTVTEVVDSVSNCDEFLIKQCPPQVPGILQCGKILDQNRYKAVCQTYQNQRRFLTLYDTENRIPVFSACKYKGEEQPGRPKTPWKIEPQVCFACLIYKITFTKQSWGHLFPVSHAFDTNDKNSTFTLTNIVPQDISFNSGSWQQMENCTKCVLQNYCINNNGDPEGFVVTGARPSRSNTLNKWVNIPSMLWTAFCCYSHNTKDWLASTKTLAELYQELSVKSKCIVVYCDKDECVSVIPLL
uniref:Uncharacterized protein n=1 Tax=Acanthochromis polyacanthus TaxID=80966 RepID=A0A3Q1FXM7_9TELE